MIGLEQGMWARLKQTFYRLTLSERFMLASLVILMAGLVGIGAWVSRQIENGVVHRTGATTALYVESFVAPHIQNLDPNGELPLESISALNTLLIDSPMGQQIVAFKVWDPRGKLLYSNDPTIIGKSFPMHEGLLQASRLGVVVSDISILNQEENADLGVVYKQLLETYSPIWKSGTNEIIAVAEFYQITNDLQREINTAQRQSWLLVGAAILIMYLLLAGFVRRASNTILQQQLDLGKSVDQLTGLLSENRELSERVRRASASVALLNEGYLHRIGAELHDGPAQDLGLSLLKLDSIKGKLEDSSADPSMIGRITEIENSLQNAMKEVRGIAAGLSLPELTDLSLLETLTRVVRTHERQTGSRVQLNLGSLPEQVTLPLKITAYRIIQEALNNSFHHAGGAETRVEVTAQGDLLNLEISDQGQGMEPASDPVSNGRLGVSGMRERAESLGGHFRIESVPGQGTRVIVQLPVNIERSRS